MLLLLGEPMKRRRVCDDDDDDRCCRNKAKFTRMVLANKTKNKTMITDARLTIFQDRKLPTMRLEDLYREVALIDDIGTSGQKTGSGDVFPNYSRTTTICYNRIERREPIDRHLPVQ